MSHVVIHRTSKLRSIVVSPWNSSIGPITALSLGWSSFFSKSGSCRIMLKSCIKRWNRRSQNTVKLERRQWDSSVARTLLRVTMRKCYRNWNITYDWDKLKFHHLEKYASDCFVWISQPRYSNSACIKMEFSFSSCRKFELLLYHSSLDTVLRWHSTCHNQSTPLTGSQNQHQNLMTSTGLSSLHRLCRNGLLRLSSSSLASSLLSCFLFQSYLCKVSPTSLH